MSAADGQRISRKNAEEEEHEDQHDDDDDDENDTEVETIINDSSAGRQFLIEPTRKQISTQTTEEGMS